MERNGAREMEERRCIRDTGRVLKKYGSTAKHMTRTESLVKHTVCPTDTLQGIALKYGVTVQPISMCIGLLFVCLIYVLFWVTFHLLEAKNCTMTLTFL